MVFLSISRSEKNQLQIGKKLKKFRKIFFITLFAKKNQSEKKFDTIYSLKCSLHKPRKINETMNPKFFWQKNEAVILDDGNFVGPKSSLFLCCSSRKRTVSVSFISFEKYELGMRKNFSKVFLSSFLPKTSSMKKNFDNIFRPKCSL